MAQHTASASSAAAATEPAATKPVAPASSSAATAPAPTSAADRRLTVPNAISLARIAAVPVFAWLLLTERDVAAVALLAGAGASDWVDGVIARRFNQGSRLGALLDPAADRLFIAVTLVGLALRGVVPWWLVAAVVAREAAVGLVLLALRRRGWGTLPVHFVGKAGTLALMYAFPALLLGSLGGVVGSIMWTLGWAFAIWGVGLYWLAGLLYLHQAAGLFRGGSLGR